MMLNSLSNIRVVLLNPIYGGNVGSVCRAMANMGLSDLFIVGSPELELKEARRMACWASNILEARKQTATLAEAVRDCTSVFGATARRGLYRSHARTPKEAAPAILEAAKSGKAALLFGPEDNGLSNEDLALCTQLIQIPSSAEYPSLNLSHAVIICAYEVFVLRDASNLIKEKSEEADSGLKERMFEMWEQSLLDIGFMKEDKARHMMLGLRRVFSRGRLSRDDVRILMGVARQIGWYSEHGTGKQKKLD